MLWHKLRGPATGSFHTVQPCSDRKESTESMDKKWTWTTTWSCAKFKKKKKKRWLWSSSESASPNQFRGRKWVIRRLRDELEICESIQSGNEKISLHLPDETMPLGSKQLLIEVIRKRVILPSGKGTHLGCDDSFATKLQDWLSIFNHMKYTDPL